MGTNVKSLAVAMYRECQPQNAACGPVYFERRLNEAIARQAGDLENYRQQLITIRDTLTGRDGGDSHIPDLLTVIGAEARKVADALAPGDKEGLSVEERAESMWKDLTAGDKLQGEDRKILVRHLAAHTAGIRKQLAEVTSERDQLKQWFDGEGFDSLETTLVSERRAARVTVAKLERQLSEKDAEIERLRKKCNHNAFDSNAMEVERDEAIERQGELEKEIALLRSQLAPRGTAERLSHAVNEELRKAEVRYFFDASWFEDALTPPQTEELVWSEETDDCDNTCWKAPHPDSELECFYFVGPVPYANEMRFVSLRMPNSEDDQQAINADGTWYDEDDGPYDPPTTPAAAKAACQWHFEKGGE